MLTKVMGPIVSGIVAVVGMIFGYGSHKWFSRKKEEPHQTTAQQQLARILGLDVAKLNLTAHEIRVARNLLLSGSIKVSFDDIAGLDDTIRELKYRVILPFSRPELFDDALRQAPRGVLLYGPPGCGKTMLVKAIARETGVRFLNLSAATLTDKWYGESQKLASAVFSLADKIKPCIIFIDEIDSFLRSRVVTDDETTAMIKGQFLSLWDGLLSSKKNQIVVIGATNRPKHLDEAIKRRMPIRLEIKLPNREERKKILELTLRNEEVDSDLDLDKLAVSTPGFSGCELIDVCRRAAYQGLKEIPLSAFEKQKGVKITYLARQDFKIRGISMIDLESAIHAIKITKSQTYATYSLD